MIFFTEPVRTSPYSPDYYPRHPVVLLSARARATRYLAEQRERAWALRYQQQPVNQPTQIALLAQEYDEFPDQQCMMHIFAHHRANAEKFLEEAETDLEDFLPPDQEPCLTIFEPFDLPDHSISTSTSKVIVQDEPLLKDVMQDCVMTESHRAAEYRSEVLSTLQSILGCLSADTSVQANANEEGNTSP
ncbi:hypothetical protein C8R48DRAFT_762275 [Suillus tomentosus]|nr:hypothetical protein C8R48DRAFT_762275 [Suillus tomentosus]